MLHLAAPAGSDGDVASVHDLAQAPKDHGHTGTQADHGTDLDASVDVTPYNAVPPLVEVVIAPDDRVDAEREVGKDDPENERTSCDISL